MEGVALVPGSTEAGGMQISSLAESNSVLRSWNEEKYGWPTPVTPVTQRTLTDSKPKEGALQTQQAAAVSEDSTETAYYHLFLLLTC